MTARDVMILAVICLVLFGLFYLWLSLMRIV